MRCRNVRLYHAAAFQFALSRVVPVGVGWLLFGFFWAFLASWGFALVTAAKHLRLTLWPLDQFTFAIVEIDSLLGDAVVIALLVCAPVWLWKIVRYFVQEHLGKIDVAAGLFLVFAFLVMLLATWTPEHFVSVARLAQSQPAYGVLFVMGLYAIAVVLTYAVLAIVSPFSRALRSARTTPYREGYTWFLQALELSPLMDEANATRYGIGTFVLRIVSVVGFFIYTTAIAFVPIAGAEDQTFWEDFVYFQGGLAVLVAFNVLASLLMLWLRRSMRSRMTIEEVFDAKSPSNNILFLRSFDADAKRFSFNPLQLLDPFPAHLEQPSSIEHAVFVRFASRGQLIAVTDPKSTEPGLFTRVPLPHAEWQGYVGRLMSEATAIVIVGGASEGVLWEIEQASGEELRSRTIVLFPAKIGASQRSRILAAYGVEVAAIDAAQITGVYWNSVRGRPEVLLATRSAFGLHAALQHFERYLDERQHEYERVMRQFARQGVAGVG